MTELIFLVEEDPEGGYTTRALGQSIFTEADTLDELRANIREAVQCHFEEGGAPDVVLPKMDVRQAILSGLADSNAGRTFSVEQVRAQFDLPL
jgi:hypothetical protein